MLNVVVVFSLPPFLSYEENEMGIYEIPQTKRDSVMQIVCATRGLLDRRTI